MRYLFLILISIQFLFSNENYFLLDSVDLDIGDLLNYQKQAEKIHNKTEKANFLVIFLFLYIIKL